MPDEIGRRDADDRPMRWERHGPDRTRAHVRGGPDRARLSRQGPSSRSAPRTGARRIADAEHEGLRSFVIGFQDAATSVRSTRVFNGGRPTSRPDPRGPRPAPSRRAASCLSRRRGPSNRPGSAVFWIHALAIGGATGSRTNNLTTPVVVRPIEFEAWSSIVRPCAACAVTFPGSDALRDWASAASGQSNASHATPSILHCILLGPSSSKSSTRRGVPRSTCSCPRLAVLESVDWSHPRRRTTDGPRVL